MLVGFELGAGVSGACGTAEGFVLNNERHWMQGGWFHFVGDGQESQNFAKLVQVSSRESDHATSGMW